MSAFKFNLQRFAITPTLISDEDGEHYFNTIPGAQVVGFGDTFFVNHGAGCKIQCSNADSHTRSRQTSRLTARAAMTIS